jgi:L-fucose mutarotase/ribose pyranase (RbsD/FucU family)
MNGASRETQPDWERKLEQLLPLYGHRNWIVIADAAYPAQSRPGIETIVTGAQQIEVVAKVLGALAAAPHVRANVYLDEELEFVAEADAAGVTRYCEQLAGLLESVNRVTLSHDHIIAKLDQTAQLFNVLILKTTMTIPYTSVFFELGCGYWTNEAETRLRQAIAASE